MASRSDATAVAVKQARLRRWWTAVGYLLIVIVVYLSLTPAPLEIPVEQGDKYGHVLAYATLMFWFAQLHTGHRPRVLWACAFVAMGIGLEFVQRLTDYRTFEIADMIADACGVLIGWLIAPPRLPSLLALVESRIVETR
jgi:VanZ family protein